MSFTISDIEHISAPELREWILADASDFLVVDVRDSDHIGGNIVRSVHLPSATITQDSLERLAQRVAASGVSRVVFHCMLSQQRGPRAALAFGRLLRSSGRSGINVYVLDRGFNGWQKRYRNEPALMENYSADLW